MSDLPRVFEKVISYGHFTDSNFVMAFVYDGYHQRFVFTLFLTFPKNCVEHREESKYYESKKYFVYEKIFSDRELAEIVKKECKFSEVLRIMKEENKNIENFEKIKTLEDYKKYKKIKQF